MVLIIGLAGQAPSRRSRLSSNVRQQIASPWCSPALLGRQSPPNAKCLPCSAPWRFASTMVPFLSGLAALALAVQSQGASRATFVSTRSPAKPRLGACASSEWSHLGEAACSKFTPRLGCPQRGRISGRRRAWCSRAVSWRISASAVAAQGIACLAAALACTKHCCLTLRSSGTATGKALGPRGSHCHHPPRGPSAFPASAP